MMFRGGKPAGVSVNDWPEWAPRLPHYERDQLVRAYWYPVRFELRAALNEAGARAGDTVELSLKTATLKRDDVATFVALRRLFAPF